MKTEIFDGYQVAESLLVQLKAKADALTEQGRKPVVAAILFKEDTGSVLYTQLKQEATQKLGIDYQVHRFSLLDPLANIVRRISELNQDSKITGIIIQKPWRKTWIELHAKSEANFSKESDGEELKEAFADWWGQLVVAINPVKDVDGLHPATYQAIIDGTWQAQKKVLPATARAVLRILQQAFKCQDLTQLLAKLSDQKIIILGKSDLLGKPLQALFSSNNVESEMIGSKELKERIENKILLKDAAIVISATGRKNLVTGEMVKEGVIVVDVGEPQGDVERETMIGRASFLTPVPGGVGPMTVVCLMENAISMI